VEERISGAEFVCRSARHIDSFVDLALMTTGQDLYTFVSNSAKHLVVLARSESQLCYYAVVGNASMIL